MSSLSQGILWNREELLECWNASPKPSSTGQPTVLTMPGLIRQADWAGIYREMPDFNRQPRRIFGPGTHAQQLFLANRAYNYPVQTQWAVASPCGAKVTECAPSSVRLLGQAGVCVEGLPEK
jgi:hypothetical protein